MLREYLGAVGLLLSTFGFAGLLGGLVWYTDRIGHLWIGITILGGVILFGIPAVMVFGPSVVEWVWRRTRQ